MSNYVISLVPSAAIISMLGLLSAYSFHMIARISHGEIEKTETKSLSEAWKDEVGKDSAWVVSLACLLVPFGCVLTYSIVLGDMLSSLAKSAGAKGFFCLRQNFILSVTSLAIYPLCKVKTLAALSPLSMAGVIGMFLTCLFMGLRALPGSPYSTNGGFLTTLAPSMQPSFGKVGLENIFSSQVLILISMAATSYLVHFTSHDFYDGLKDCNPRRFGLLTMFGFTITTIINIAIMCFGFATFGGNCQGFILNNYSVQDIGATICRIIVSISLLGSYPIVSLFSLVFCLNN